MRRDHQIRRYLQKDFSSSHRASQSVTGCACCSRATRRTTMRRVISCRPTCCRKSQRQRSSSLTITLVLAQPLARELEAPIFMPLDVQAPGQMEAVFERIKKEWGKLRFPCPFHRVRAQTGAYRPRHRREARRVPKMDISCWSFIRIAHLAEPLMTDGGAIFTMTFTTAARWSWRITILWELLKRPGKRGALHRCRTGP